MTVYLIHLNKPLDRGVSPDGKPLVAAHYVGWTDDLVGRMIEHEEGKGARFTQVAVERGIKLTLARVWEGKQANRTFERHVKNGKCAPKLCTICNPNALHLMKLEGA